MPWSDDLLKKMLEGGFIDVKLYTSQYRASTTTLPSLPKLIGALPYGAQDHGYVELTPCGTRSNYDKSHTAGNGRLRAGRGAKTR